MPLRTESKMRSAIAVLQMKKIDLVRDRDIFGDRGISIQLFMQALSTKPTKRRSQETFRIVTFNEGISLDYSAIALNLGVLFKLASTDLEHDP